MFEAKRSSKSSWRSAWSYAAIFGAAALSACVFFDPKGGGDAKNAKAIPLFNEEVPVPEAMNWDPASGLENSALGSINPVFFDPAASPLRNAGARIKFNLFAGVNLYAVVDKVTDLGGGHIVTKGHVDGYEDATFLLTTYGGMINGSVRGMEAGNFNVTFKENGVYRVGKLNDYDFNFMDVAPTGVLNPTMGSQLLAKAKALAKKNATTQIDLGFLYDTASQAGSDSTIRAKIAAAVDEANDVLENSGVDLVFNIVDTTLLPVSLDDNADTALAQIKDDAVSGTYNIIHKIRDANDADIMVIVAGSLANSVAGATTTLRSDSVDLGEENAFVIMDDGALDPGEYGVTTLVAKNMGCATDKKTGKKDPAYDAKYSRGFTFKGKDKVAYRTVEAGGEGTLVPYFSNPDITVASKPIGNAKTANNAKTLSLTGPITAAYRGDDEGAVAVINFPVDGASYGGDRLKVEVTVTDDAGGDTVTLIDTVGTDTELGVIGSTPFHAMVSGLSAGSHAICAVVTDAGGNTDTSECVTITMGDENGPSGLSNMYLGPNGRNGTVAVKDTSAYDSAWTITSNGSGSSTIDDYEFLGSAIATGGQVAANISVNTTGDSTSLYGLMVRDSANEEGAFAFLSLSKDSTVSITTRTKTLKAAKTKVLKTGVASARFLLVRKDNFAYAFYDTLGGTDWTFLTKANFASKGAAYIGYAIASGDTSSSDSFVIGNPVYKQSDNSPPTMSKVTLVAGSLTGADAGDTLTITTKVADANGATEITGISFWGYSADSTFLLGTGAKPYKNMKVPLEDGLSSVVMYAKDGTDSSGHIFTITPSDGRPVLVLGSEDTVSIDVYSGDSTIHAGLATDDGTLTFTKTGGADSSVFTLNASSGALDFNFVPLSDSDYQDADSNNTYYLTYSVTDGKYVYSQTVLVSARDTMVLTSHSGAANVNDSINEGTTAAANMDATGYGVEYFFSGLSDDEDLFNINSSTGVVTFKAAPDYENPKDADLDNIYEVLVMAWDSIDGQVEQQFNIKVLNTTDAYSNTVSALGDASVEGGDSAAVNFGSGTTLKVSDAGTDSVNIFKSIIKFSFSSVDAISAATLKLFGAASDYSDTVRVVVSSYDTTWVEGSVDFNDIVDSLLTPIDTISLTRTTNQWFSVDVSSAVSAFQTDSASYATFVLTGLDSTSTKAVFKSKDAGSSIGPQLEMTGTK